MQEFRNLPIRQKLLVMTLVICGAVLLVAIAALFVFQVLNFRANFQRDTTTLAVIIANNSTASMFFHDDAAALEVVQSFAAKSNVVSATLATAEGGVFAHYGKREDHTSLAQFPAAGESRFTRADLLLTQPVVHKGERVGTLYLRADYWTTFRQLLGFYGLMAVGILVVSISLAAFLSSRLGRTITQPVMALSHTAQIVGAKNDYSIRAPVTNQGDELGQLTGSFNEMLTRIESADAALSLSQQKMETLINSIDGIVWERAPESFDFTFISRQSEDILGYAPGTWLAQPDFWEQKLHPQDAAKTIQTAREMANRGQPYQLEYRLLAADGRAVWIRESGTVLIERGRPVAMRGIFLDITRQKHDAEQLDKLNRQLIDTSRHAGMADVATGVLHNVGNVLNSVSVSATLVAERLRRSKAVKVRQATAMLREQNGNLAGFLTADPRGKVLPEYLAAAADQLVVEQTELLGEINSVGQHIEHIKEIVAMQQSYARVSGLYEFLPAAELVEDALRLNTAAFERHHIELVREFAPGLPPVCVDRHKVLQILINLLRNAKHAMEEVQENHPPSGAAPDLRCGSSASEARPGAGTAQDAPRRVDRRMIIRVQLAAPDRVQIIVRDNGIGIRAEHLPRIFNHGFTTKKNGHGFGLHSGANAAREMGGRLTGHSAGLGQGAEFTLELPTTNPAEHPEAPRLRRNA